tara:strand:- start:1637 stop:3046 length:1410 start_codon:yes stop_codon:yes gene_type:complete
MMQIIKNEWKSLWRNKIFALLTLFFLVSLAAVTWLGIAQNTKQQAQQQAAHDEIRQKWENIDAMNPHGAAHYGSYAFKPVTALSGIDDGVNAVTGNVLRLEGHVQNEMVYSEASQSLSVSKFGKLKPSLLLQYVIPLLLIFMAFASISSEKDSGRLKLLIFQGASRKQLIFSKALSVFLYGLLLLIIVIAVQLIVSFSTLNSNELLRMTLLFFAYAMYYYIIATLATYFSARLQSNAAVLSSMLVVWLIWTIFLPNIWGNTTDALYPLPSRQDFKAAMQEDRAKGIDGHNPSDERKKALTQKVLDKYNVDDVKELPINFDGLLMQADEEYGNIVWDRHFGENHKILEKQKSTYQISGFVNPFASLQSASMGFSGSDMLHHVDFLQEAENYRRDLIKKLNDKHAYGGSKTGDWNWEADNSFYRSIADFSYTLPQIKSFGSHYLLDFICLGFWVILITVIVSLTAKKIKIG